MLEVTLAGYDVVIKGDRIFDEESRQRFDFYNIANKTTIIEATWINETQNGNDQSQHKVSPKAETTR